MNSFSLSYSNVQSANPNIKQHRSTSRFRIPHFQTVSSLKRSSIQGSSVSDYLSFTQTSQNTSGDKNRIGKRTENNTISIFDLPIDKYSSLPIEYIMTSNNQNNIKLQKPFHTFSNNKIYSNRQDPLNEPKSGCKLLKNPKDILNKKINSEQIQQIDQYRFLQVDEHLPKTQSYKEQFFKKRLFNSVRVSQKPNQMSPRMKKHESSNSSHKIYSTLLEKSRSRNNQPIFQNNNRTQTVKNSPQKNVSKSKFQSLTRLKNKVDSYISLMNDIQSKAQLNLSTCTSFQMKSTQLQNQNSPSNKNKKTLSYSKQNIDVSKFSMSSSKYLPGDCKQQLESSLSYSCRRKSTTKSLSDFIVIKKIGQGRFGQIYAAVHRRTNSLYALKKISKQYVRKHSLVQRVLLQIKIQSFLNHPNIVKLFGYFDDFQSVYMILQYMEQGSLYSQMMARNFHKSSIQLFSEQRTGSIITQILKGIDQLHQHHVIHRDIKPENIVISFGTCKLCDLGWSVVNPQNQRRSTACGTFDYTAPQILNNQPYDQRIDLWEVGILAYQLMTGKLPFYHPSKKQTYLRITNFQGNLEFPSDVPYINRSFIRGLIQRNASQRISAKSMLQHAFIRQFQ